ncbi:hypothetical protein SAMN06265348_112180 [Pedobacter westerhofensis]|uniref:Uncharacterized protein n=1 Tax=Pedobacter westerhofensis TaxID=425512 RepID=A0A521FJD3_9SPHI|nr:hypothetical protein SAMN06265348_112180 [Pedobacter westerhofensis]
MSDGFRFKCFNFTLKQERLSADSLSYYTLNYIFGVFVVSGGIVLEVSFIAVSVGGVVTAAVSVAVLSDEPDTFFVELHADAANNIEPAKTRLKNAFFIMSSICSA